MSYDHWLDLGQNQDYCNGLSDDREPDEQHERKVTAQALRSLRNQERRMGPSTVSRGLIADWQRRAEFQQVFRRADVARQSRTMTHAEHQ